MRHGPFGTAVIAIGLAFFLRGSGRRLVAGLLVAAVGIGLLEVMGPPVVLAGSIWSLISPDQAAEVSSESVLIWASQSLLHGGGYALAIIMVAVAVQVAHSLPASLEPSLHG